MKNSITFIIALTVIISTFACKDVPADLADDPIIQPAAQELTWTVGAGASEVLQIVQAEADTEIEFSMITNSLCPNSGVFVEIQLGGDVILSDKVFSFPYDFTHEVHEDAQLSVLTEIIPDPDSTIECVWLGEAECKLVY